MKEYPQLAKELTGQVTLHTSKGDIQLVLFPDLAPKTVENFIQHARQGYYNGVTFHRVIQNFMVQTGDPTGTGAGGESIYGESFEDEFSDQVFNLRGALSMANRGPNTNGSQFFIVTANQVPSHLIQDMEASPHYSEEILQAYQKDGGTPWLDNRHTVFGHVLSGWEVLDEIERTPTDIADKPLEPITIESITLLD